MEAAVDPRDHPPILWILREMEAAVEVVVDPRDHPPVLWILQEMEARRMDPSLLVQVFPQVVDPRDHPPVLCILQEMEARRMDLFLLRTLPQSELELLHRMDPALLHILLLVELFRRMDPALLLRTPQMIEEAARIHIQLLLRIFA
jgi:hypothetical protein